mgnify:CR=1 FL=1|tara:strand:+ start:420 stop:1181 length:762 start_codon:yes stop_codon:yes gene_type:complete
MSNFKRNRLLEMAGIIHRSDVLLEGDDLFGGDEGGDEGGDDAGGDDAGGDDEGGGDLFGDDEGGDEGEEGAEEGEEEEEEEEPAEQLTNDEIAEYGPGQIDVEIDNILQQIFMDSVATAKVNSQLSAGYPGEMPEEEIVESSKKYSLQLLFEGEEGEEDVVPDTAVPQTFNMDFYAQEVARYIKNYQTLLDVEGMIFSKAKQFIHSQFGNEQADDFEEKLALIHGLDFSGDYEDIAPTPVASGATTAGGGGGA